MGFCFFSGLFAWIVLRLMTVKNDSVRSSETDVEPRAVELWMWSIAVVIQGNIKYLRLLNMPLKPPDTQMAESLTSEASVSNVAILI